MGGACIRSAGASRAAAVLGAVTALSACASAPAKVDAASGALFKVQIGEIAGGVAPAPHSYWYVQREPVSYVQIGVASYRAPARRGLRAWIARLFDHRPTHEAAEPTAIAAAGLGLPVPSRVQVTNLATGAAITVRVDDKAPLAYGILQLSPAAARGLGAEPGRPLLVRVRYLSPVMAYNARSTLRYAQRDARTGSPPVALARAQIPAAAQGAAPVAIRVATSAPVAIRKVALSLRPELSPPRPEATAVRLQVGAFASLANARRAVDMLRPAGAAVIEPTRRGGLTLYRVTLPAPEGAGAAERLRTRAAQIGFADARLVGPL